ncbi:MAG: oxaloacetate decarboxylase, beta subunit [bacterium F082]|nr:MAG: oxaloacetate decarboxylase, beta subunit [bacterium F082]KWW29991.1 MAG: oxaloacetate decarboxylase, beta subunit [bacterium P201]
MLGKKSIYRRPAVIIGSLVLLMLLNMLVVNNPMFATKVADLAKTEQVSEMTVEQSNAQLAEIADAVVAESAKTAELGQQMQSLDRRVTALESKNAKVQATGKAEVKEMTTNERLKEGLGNFWLLTGFRNCKIGNLIMILVGILFIFLAVRFEFEPMLLIPIGTGIICGNIPFFQGTGVTLQEAIDFAQNAIASGAYSFDLETAKAMLLTIFDGDGNKHMVLSEAIKQVDHLKLTEYGLAATEVENVKAFLNEVFQSGELNLQTGLYQKGSVLNYLYFGVTSGVYPPLIFLGIGAMTDFSSLIANPKLMILGAAAQLGVFLTFIGALYLGFNLREAGAIGIIGGADGPTAIFLSSRLANGMNGTRNLIGPIAIAAYSYMALVPVIQPPIIRLLTTKEERLIKMRAPRMVNKTEKIMFPVVGLILTTFISPTALPLLGMLFFGNIIKESGVVKRLQNTASNPLIDIVTMILGLTVGASTQASVFLTMSSIEIFVLGALSFCVATAGGLLGAKFMNLFLKEKINPMIGAAGVSAVPDSARVVEVEGQKYDPSNHLLMHAMAPNVSGVIGSAVAAGVMMSFLMM